MLNVLKALESIPKNKKNCKVKYNFENKDFFRGCDQLLSYMISKLPESPHKHLKYAHYHNLVYRSIFGFDAKTLRIKRRKSKKDLVSDIMSDLELMICGRAFIDLSNSISRGDSYKESKELIFKKYGGILVK